MGLLGLLRDYTPEFVCLFTFVPLYLKPNCDASLFVYPPSAVTKSPFSKYFAGLFEGDGTIIVPKRERSDRGRLYYPSIELCFSAKDLPFALSVQKELGFGSLQKISGKNAYNLAVKDFAGLLFVFSLLNGNLRTESKQAQLARLAV